jgi:hypothetical protein
MIPSSMPVSRVGPLQMAVLAGGGAGAMLYSHWGGVQPCKALSAPVSVRCESSAK